MPSTTRGFRYPLSSAAADVPTDIHNLADDVQAEFDGTVPVGALDSTGSVWVDHGGSGGKLFLGAAADTEIHRRQANQLGTSGGLVLGVGSGALDALATFPSGSVDHPFRVTNAGVIWLGTGAGATDTSIARDSNGVAINRGLAVTGNETVGGTLGVTGASTLASAAVTGNATVGGTLSVTGLLQAADGTYQTLRTGVAALNPGAGAGTFVVQENGAAGQALAGAVASVFPFYFDPALYAITGKTTKLLLRAMLGVGTAPAITITAGLYPITGISAANYTAGTVTSGSTVAFASPAANTPAQGNSGDFSAPSAGYYALGVVTSGTPAAASGLRVTLQLRHV